MRGQTITKTLLTINLPDGSFRSGVYEPKLLHGQLKYLWSHNDGTFQSFVLTWPRGQEGL